MTRLIPKKLTSSDRRSGSRAAINCVCVQGEANRYMATARACLGIATLLVNNGQHEDAEVHFANADHVRSFRHKQRLEYVVVWL